jgi:hypothetical protein
MECVGEYPEAAEDAGISSERVEVGNIVSRLDAGGSRSDVGE